MSPLGAYSDITMDTDLPGFGGVYGFIFYETISVYTERRFHFAMFVQAHNTV